ncbi:hypothetical protein EBQ81_01010, partial [bacterium]|nr:hypothetical protein [bacterium]
AEGEVLRVKRGEVTQVKLTTGEIVWVRPEFFTSEARPVAAEPEGVLEGVQSDFELGSDEEVEDIELEEGEQEDSFSVRNPGRTEQGWVPTYPIRQDQRILDGYTRNFTPHLRGVDEASRDSPWAYFWAFFPVAALDEALGIMLRAGRQKWADFQMSRHLFFTWLGVWFRMCADKLRDRDSHWVEGAATAQWYRETMSAETFKRIHAVLQVPQYPPDALEKVEEAGLGEDKFQWIRRWLHACNDSFKAAWEPGTYLTVDETMVFWTGMGPVHLTYIPRKPSPLGVMFKVTCCSESGILLHAELVEGAVVDGQKRYVTEYRATTACTLRLTEPWWATGRVVIADAWFGSVRTVEELLDVGLYAIVCVKQGCAGFPRAALREVLKQRGDVAFFEATVGIDKGGRKEFKKVYAGGHMDKQPLIVCFSTGTTLPGEKKVRHRSKLQQGEVVKAQYTLEQPQVHALYRKYFNAVDLFNKASGQPGTLPDVWKTKKAYRRLFAATVAWIETNAMLAFNKNRASSKLTKQQWFMRLSEACINNPFAPPRPGAADIFQGHGGPKMD